MTVDVTNYVAAQRGSTNTVDKSGSQDALASGASNLSSSYETFLSLLTAQLKNQDPTSPLDTNSFTQQLVQMTGVQQQLLSNTLLKSLVTQGSNGNVGDAISLIGKTATVAGSDSALKDGKASWSYNLDKVATKATLTITDSAGKVMWTGSAPDLGKGEHAFTWDGKGTVNGTEGKVYTLTVAASDAAGAKVATATTIQGVVQSVRQSDGGMLININGAEAPLTGVTAVKA